MKRDTRKSIADETVAILKHGEYRSPSGRAVSLKKSLAETWKGTVCYSPRELTELIEAQMASDPAGPSATVTVRNQTTLEAARELLADGSDRVVCLNFASAKNPGGGFLGGAEAQEEAICRPSALYASLLKERDTYYRANRLGRNALYTDHLIYSPGVAVFRDEADGSLLEEFWHSSFVTAPAPNRGAIEQNSPELVPEIERVFRNRIRGVLAAMAAHRHRHVVLGAWGCGVFRNDPTKVARWFRETLLDEGWASKFDQVRFGVLDRRGLGIFRSFEGAF
ncbi:MAG: TIGR02452 family protein [Verrucomicrobiae bacterium]|nr:TIGR02452 family protein [Verrucomicrobiae bacterium]